MSDTTIKPDTKQALSFNGLYVHGTLEGVDFTKSGTSAQISWGSSLKLNFSFPFEKKQIVQGIEVKSNAKRYQIIQISCPDDLLPFEVEKYNKMIGQHITLNLEPAQGATFKVA